MLKNLSKHFSQRNKILVLILLGSISWCWTMVKSGWLYPYGMGFWGANGHDGVWHIALSEMLMKGSFENPVFSGEVLKNYHLGFDLVLAALSKLSFMSPVNLYFQVIPVIFSVATGILVYRFSKKWTGSRAGGLWALFFTYFGGSFGWVLGKGESAFWSQQSISTLINPPFAMSLVVILLGLISLEKFLGGSKKHYLLCILFFGLLTQIKIYAALIVLTGLFAAAIYSLVSEKKNELLRVSLGTLAVFLLLFIPFNKNSSGLIVWQPFWFLETMMALSDRIGWDKFYSAMTNYRSGGVYHKLIPAYFVALGIFLAGNLGTRIIAFFTLFRKKFWSEKKQVLDIFLYAGSAAGIIVPMFFLQKGTPWNTIQFFYYSLFFLGLLSAKFLSGVRLNKFFVSVVVLATIPTSVISLKDVYIPGRPPAMIPTTELEALRFLKAASPGTVLTYPFDTEAAKAAESNPPRPLRLYVSTGYVAAFSGQVVFLEDEINLDITGYDWKRRREEVMLWYEESDKEVAREFLRRNNIKYIYWARGQRAILGESQLGIKEIFGNGDVTVYEVE